MVKKKVTLLFLAFVSVAYFTIFPGSPQAATEWLVLKTLDLKAAPLDVAPSLDGQWIYILTPGELHTYSVQEGKVTDQIPVDKEFDRIASVPKGTVAYIDWAGSTTDNTQYLITSVDYQGNESGAAPINSQVADTTAPAVSLSSPIGNTTVSGTVSVSANASDNVGVTRVEFYVNGALQGADTASPYTFTWNTSLLTNGAYTLSAKAYDAAGNVGQSANVSVTVSNPVPDTTPPTISLSSPFNGSTVSGTVVATASASDNVGVNTVSCTASSAAGTPDWVASIGASLEETGPAQAAELPDWLPQTAPVQEETAPAAELPEWLQTAQATAAQPPAQPETRPEEEAPTLVSGEGAPDWMKAAVTTPLEVPEWMPARVSRPRSSALCR